MIRVLYEVLKVYTFDGLVAQLVRAPPCHGGGHGFDSRLGRFIWDLSSAGRASALQAEGHRFEPYSGSYGSMVKRLRHRPFTAVTRVRFPLESLIC